MASLYPAVTEGAVAIANATGIMTEAGDDDDDDNLTALARSPQLADDKGLTPYPVPVL